MICHVHLVKKFLNGRSVASLAVELYEQQRGIIKPLGWWLAYVEQAIRLQMRPPTRRRR